MLNRIPGQKGKGDVGWTLQHGVNIKVLEKLSGWSCAAPISFLCPLPVLAAMWGSKGLSFCVCKISSSGALGSARHSWESNSDIEEKKS